MLTLLGLDRRRRLAGAVAATATDSDRAAAATTSAHTRGRLDELRHRRGDVANLVLQAPERLLVDLERKLNYFFLARHRRFLSGIS